MKIHLIVRRTLVASHSLDTREVPHPHLFRFEFDFTGEPIRGRIIDLPMLENELTKMLEPFQNRYLNDCPDLPAPAREFPTCETLGVAFTEKSKANILPELKRLNPSLRLVSVLVTLYEPDGQEFGSAKIICDEELTQ